jgi:aminopeptidase N
VVSQDLIDAFTFTMAQNNANDFDFEQAFRTWETQAGYPVIHVTLSDSVLHVTQQRFFANSSLNQGDTSSWFIPLNYATSTDPNFTDTSPTNFFTNGEPSLDIPLPAAPDDADDFWFIFNKQQRGYYRVNYDEGNWNAISRALYNATTKDRIHVMNRVQLLEDSFALVEAGYLDDYDVAFGILRYMHLEDDYFAWYVANRYISKLYEVFGYRNDELNVSKNLG